MIATDALPHVAHKSTVENRRKNLNLRDIEHLSLCLWCSMALWAKSGLLGQGEGWRIHVKQNLDVTSRAYGVQAELAAPDLPEQFLATRAPDLFAIGVVHGLSLTPFQANFPVADPTTDHEQRCPFTTLAPSAQATDGDSQGATHSSLHNSHCMGLKLLLSAELAAPARASSALECPRPSGDTAHTFGLRASPNVRQARSPIAGRGSGAASPRFPARCGGSSESNARPAAWGCRGSGRRCGRRNTVPSERIPWTLPPAPTRRRARAVQRANPSAGPVVEQVRPRFS